MTGMKIYQVVINVVCANVVNILLLYYIIF